MSQADIAVLGKCKSHMGKAHHRALDLLVLGLDRSDGLAEAEGRVVCLVLGFLPLFVDVRHDSLCNTAKQ